jgi:hypothetical protein
MNWFDYRESQLYQWVRKNTIDRISQGEPESFGAWKERSEAVDAVKTYLSDPPSKNHYYQSNCRPDTIQQPLHSFMDLRGVKNSQSCLKLSNPWNGM